MISNDPINVLYNWEGEERERSTQHASDLFLIIQWLLMGLKQTNIRVLQRGFSFLMENIVVFGGGEQMDSHSTDETKVAIKYPGLWKDRAFAWTADFSFFFS